MCSPFPLLKLQCMQPKVDMSLSAALDSPNAKTPDRMLFKSCSIDGDVLDVLPISFPIVNTRKKLSLLEGGLHLSKKTSSTSHWVPTQKARGPLSNQGTHVSSSIGPPYFDPHSDPHAFVRSYLLKREMQKGVKQPTKLQTPK